MQQVVGECVGWECVCQTETGKWLNGRVVTLCPTPCPMAVLDLLLCGVGNML